MADRLTQLQDSLDDLLTQMFATLTYINNRAPYGEIPGQVSRAPSARAIPGNDAAPAAAQTNGDTQPDAKPDEKSDEKPAQPAPEELHPDPPAHFNATLHELAQDLVLKEQQIEYLINSLPGIGTSEEDQMRRMRELEAELREVEKERVEAEGERERLVDVLGEAVTGLRRVG